jgi:hypothetical protein
MSEFPLKLKLQTNPKIIYEAQNLKEHQISKETPNLEEHKNLK